MKTLKSILTATAMLFICVAVNASVKPIADKATRVDVVNIYIDAITHGNTQKLDNVLDENMEYDLKRGENTNSIKKDQFIAYVKGNTASSEAVTTNTTVLSEDDQTATIKVEFKYSDSIRTDVLTLNKTGAWQITKIVSSFN